MTKRQKQRAIADILAVLIAIGITVVAGVALYSIVMGKLSVFGNSAGLEITNAQITNGVLVVTIKNTGTYTFTSALINVYSNGGQWGPGWTNFPLPSGGLAPGQSASNVWGFGDSPGTAYTITIQASYSGGQGQYTTSVTVIGT